MFFCKKVKEIINKRGERIFTRFALFYSTYFAIYIHKLYASDSDPYPHNHPWNYISFVLQGGYREHKVKLKADGTRISKVVKRKRFSLAYSGRKAYHRILRLFKTPTVTLFITWGKHQEWHYLNDNNLQISNSEFRQHKSEHLVQTTKQ